MKGVFEADPYPRRTGDSGITIATAPAKAFEGDEPAMLVAEAQGVGRLALPLDERNLLSVIGQALDTAKSIGMTIDGIDLQKAVESVVESIKRHDNE